MEPQVLFIDDDPNLLEGLQRTMRREGFGTHCAQTIEAARAIMAAVRVDLVVCDENMPGTSGSDFLAEIRRSHPATLRMMLSGQATLGAVVQAINAGEVFRFLLKPCCHADLVETLRHALAHKQLLDSCRHALHMFKRQNDFLQQLERKHPGILEHGVDPGILAPADRSATPETLLDEITVEIERASGLHRALAAGKSES